MKTVNFENYGTLYNCDVLDGMKQLPNESVDCVITSPPYWQLRDYGYPEQWGLEPTYKEYLAHLQELMTEIWRVLKPQGTVWVNLGDSYFGSGGSGGDYNKGGLREGQPKVIPSKKDNMPTKCLMLIPHRFAIDCIDNGWILRNDIIWAKPNGMPESVTDRFSKKHEFMFFFVKQQKYYFDLDSVREKTKPFRKGGKKKLALADNAIYINKNLSKITEYNPLGKNCGDVSDFWEIPTKPSKTEHYATYNDSLIKKPILAGCPEGGVILDCFNGTGTTCTAAIHYGRKFIGIEASSDYFNISIQQIEHAIFLDKAQKAQGKMF